MKKTYQIMIVAGEVSGDSHAAKLVRALRDLAPESDFEFFGATGPQLREAGVETIINADELAIVGVPEIARALPMFWSSFQTLKQEAIKRKPDAVILVDFPEFNLKLAKPLKKKGLTIIYYISPQIWAWRKYRIRTFRKYVDLLLAILPFEKDWYQKEGVSSVEYVGNPLAREVSSALSKEEFCGKHALDPAKPIIALLPGSRHKEIVRILPEMLKTIALMAEKDATLQFVIALASTRKFIEIEDAFSDASADGLKLPDVVLTVKGETREALRAADAAAVASGTATLETAIIGTPMVIVYKSSAFNYKTMRPLIKIEHFGLVNLIAGARLAPELIQDDFTKENLAGELFRLLESEENQRMRAHLADVSEKLGRGGASKRAAEAVLREISETER